MNLDKQNSLDVEGDINCSEQRRVWNTLAKGVQTKSLLEKDAQFFFHQSMSTPCLDVVSSVSGSNLTTLDRKQLLDFHGNGVHQLGYNHPKLIEALKAQLDSLSFSPRRYTNEVAVDLAQQLAALTGEDLNRLLLTPNGSAAVGIALKLARAYTGKHKVISFWDSYHGASMDVASYSGEAIFQSELGALLPGSIRVPGPNSYRKEVFENEHDLLNYIEYIMEKDPEIGAFLAEPIRNTDVQIPSSLFWKQLRVLCDRFGIVLIFDEIPLAFGRTGKLFAHEHFGITPDLLCLGKGMGGGVIPQAAVIGRERFNQFAHLSMGHYTFEKHPLGARAALSVLSIIEEENLLEKVVSDGEFMKTELEGMRSKHHGIGDVRGTGLLWAIELVYDREQKIRDAERAERVMYYCLQNGLNFKVSKSNVIQLMPPLTISRTELKKAITILDQALTQTQPS
jgi:4-aminobutyrate aminotransferase